MSIGSHQSPVNQTDVWLTPPEVLAALGDFDLDPCAPEHQPWKTATKTYSLPVDGLAQPWDGRVWLNPPYGGPAIITPWMKRMADHNHGTTLIFARTETAMFFQQVWRRASGLLFIEGRLHFHHADGTRAKANSGAPSVLVAYGDYDQNVLAETALPGQFVPLRLPRGYVVAALEETWSDIVAAYVRGPVRVDELYRLIARHPKARGREHWKAKIRQTLQRGPFRPLGDGVWEAA